MAVPSKAPRSSTRRRSLTSNVKWSNLPSWWRSLTAALLHSERLRNEEAEKEKKKVEGEKRGRWQRSR